MNDHRQNFAVVRTYNVEALNNTLKQHGKIICSDSKLDHSVEIRFLTEKPEETDFKDKVKLELIKKILET